MQRRNAHRRHLPCGPGFQFMHIGIGTGIAIGLGFFMEPSMPIPMAEPGMILGHIWSPAVDRGISRAYYYCQQSLSTD